MLTTASTISYLKHQKQEEQQGISEGSGKQIRMNMLAKNVQGCPQKYKNV